MKTHPHSWDILAVPFSVPLETIQDISPESIKRFYSQDYEIEANYIFDTLHYVGKIYVPERILTLNVVYIGGLSFPYV